MKLPFFLLFFISSPVMAEVRDDALFKQGEEALADSLWDVAALQFEKLISSRPLSTDEKSAVAMRLAEAWIRNNEPGKALELLDQSFIAESPGIHFWKGHALAGIGRFHDAIQELEKASEPNHPFSTEASLTQAALLLSLHQSDQALSILKQLSGNPDPRISIEARLRRAEIFLDLGKIEEAKKTMPALEDVPEPLVSEANYLEACLLLAENKATLAGELFFSLVSQRSGRNLHQHHAAVLGYADALARQGKKSEASESLLSFIQENPTSDMLDQAFSRLVEWLPDELSPNHPVLQRLSQWAAPVATKNSGNPQSGLIQGLITDTPSSVTTAWPEVSSPDPLAIHATYALAESLHRIPTGTYKDQAYRLMQWIELNYPQHPLAAQAWLRTARWLLDDGKGEQAFAILDYLRQHSANPSVGGEAAFAQAEAYYQRGEFEEASRLFDEASNDLVPSHAKDVARLNSALSRFREHGNISTVLNEQPGNSEQNHALEADLELEQALASTPTETRQVALETFIKKHSDHPRAAEARLAAAEAALTTQPPDESYARAQLDTIATDEKSLASISGPRYELARLRLTERAGDPAATIAAAKAFIEKFPNDPSTPEAELTLGRNLYDSGSYNDARLVLQQLAEHDTDPVRKQSALLLAASSAARVGTPQSRQEALDLFDKAGATDGPLNALITMKKAQLMIDLNRLQEATDFLRKWYHSLPEKDPLKLPAGFLFGDAAYALGGKNPELLAESLAIYDELLNHPATQPADRHRIQYLRGKTLEQLPREDDPTQKRESEALAAYYSVLKNAENPPAEWHFLESSGFRALEILERAGEKKALPALNIAREIAALKGPRAKEAADRAKDIQLKNQIWED